MRKKYIILELRLSQSDEIQNNLEEAGLDVMDYLKRWGRYRLRLTKQEIQENREMLIEMMQKAYEQTR